MLRTCARLARPRSVISGLRSNNVRCLSTISRNRSVGSRGYSVLAASNMTRFPVSALKPSGNAVHSKLVRGSLSTSVRAFSSDLPDYIPLEMPALSPTPEQTSGNLVSWEKKEGDFVGVGQVIAEIETDKTTVGWESQEEGYLARILVDGPADDVPYGKMVGILVDSEEDVAAFKDFKDPDADADAGSKAPEPEAPEPEAPKQESKSAEPAQQAPSSSSSSAPRGEGVFATPKARMVANERGVDVNDVSGTGPKGRVLAADVQEFQGKPAAAAQPSHAAPASTDSGYGAEYEDVPLSNVRKVIARRLSESKQTIPHYQVTMECNMQQVMELRKKLNQEEGVKLSVNDFIVKASALALRKVPDVNVSWMGDSIRRYNYVDISVAVSTPTGLITPIVRDADCKGLQTISEEVRDLAGRARDNKLAPEEFNGGTFTISNLGMYGVSSFSAIINPPQSAILAVGTAVKRMVFDDVNGSGPAPIMSATISCDHRTVDGALGAEWLQAFKSYIEQPHRMLL